MSTPDKFDTIADSIVKKELAAYFVSPRPMSARISAEPFDLRLAIAEALRAAYTQGHTDGWMHKRPGDLTPDDVGR
jgi:hypothetical protein